MIERQAGSIIIVASLGAYLGIGMIGACHLTTTNFARRLWEDPNGVDIITQLTSYVPHRRAERNVAGAAMFLAADAGAFMTGQSMIIDRGMSTGPARP